MAGESVQLVFGPLSQRLRQHQHTNTTDDLYSARESCSPPPPLSLIFFTLLVFPFTLLHPGCHRPLHLCPPISSLLRRALSTCRLFAAVGHFWCSLLRQRLSHSLTTLISLDLFYRFCRCHYCLPLLPPLSIPLAFVDPLLMRPAMANRPPTPSPPSLLSARISYQANIASTRNIRRTALIV
jgi:hypothetical protein